MVLIVTLCVRPQEIPTAVLGAPSLLIQEGNYPTHLFLSWRAEDSWTTVRFKGGIHSLSKLDRRQTAKKVGGLC